jgi:hypothetical protein
MSLRVMIFVLLTMLAGRSAWGLSLAPEELHASRQLACVLAEQSLGYLSEDEYGELTHKVLDGFDNGERDTILAKALGYYDGLMFSVASDDLQQVNERLEEFVASASCRDQGFRSVTVSL